MMMLNNICIWKDNDIINYGLQLYGKVKVTENDPKNRDLKAIQKVQNKMARFLNSKTLKDKIKSKVLLENINMLSVNQLNAKIKILEIWKSLNITNYPLKIDTKVEKNNVTNTRAMTKKSPLEVGTSCLTKKSCISDAIRIWKIVPQNIKDSETIFTMKKKTREFVLTLPM